MLFDVIHNNTPVYISDSLSEIIVGIILTIAGIVVLIAGVIVLILDRRRISPRTHTTSSSATTNENETIVLASWIDRFIAWLIDFIIVSIGLGILFAAISLPFWIAFPQMFESTDMNISFRSLGAPWLPYAVSSFVFMAYWTYFESTTGQSLGKKLLHLKTTDLAGKSIDVKAAVIESFGKAFLLPVDVILGWILTNNKRQRIGLPDVEIQRSNTKIVNATECTSITCSCTTSCPTVVSKQERD